MVPITVDIIVLVTAIIKVLRKASNKLVLYNYSIIYILNKTSYIKIKII